MEVRAFFNFQELSNWIGIDILICWFIIVLLVIVGAYAIFKALQSRGHAPRTRERPPSSSSTTHHHHYTWHSPFRHHRSERREERYVEKTKVITKGFKYCKACGASNKEDALFCSDCGELM